MFGVVLGGGVAAPFPVVGVLAARLQVNRPALNPRNAAQDGRALDDGELVHHFGHPVLEDVSQRRPQRGVGDRLRAVHRHAVAVDEESLLKRAVLPHGAGEVVGRADRHYHGRQMRRVERGERRLVGAGVGIAHRPDFAIAPLLNSEPFHRIVSILGFFRERVPLAFGREPPADVLNGDDVAAPREELGAGRLARGGFVVWRPLQDDGEAPRRALAGEGGEVEVGGEQSAVAHLYHDVALDADAVLGAGAFVSRRRLRRAGFVARGVLRILRDARIGRGGRRVGGGFGFGGWRGGFGFGGRSGGVLRGGCGFGFGGHSALGGLHIGGRGVLIRTVAVLRGDDGLDGFGVRLQLVPRVCRRNQLDIRPNRRLVGVVGAGGMAGRAQRDYPARVVPIRRVPNIAGDGGSSHRERACRAVLAAVELGNAVAARLRRVAVPAHRETRRVQQMGGVREERRKGMLRVGMVNLPPSPRARVVAQLAADVLEHDGLLHDVGYQRRPIGLFAVRRCEGCAPAPKVGRYQGRHLPHMPRRASAVRGYGVFVKPAENPRIDYPLQLGAEGAVYRGRGEVAAHVAVPAAQNVAASRRRFVGGRVHVGDESRVNLRRYGHRVGVNRRHVLHSRLVQFVQAVEDALSAVVGREIERDVVGVVVVHDAVVGGHDYAVARVADSRQFLERNHPAPLVFASPPRNGQPSVRHRADGDLPAIEVSDVAVDVGEHEVVAGVNPVAHGFVQLVRVSRVQHPAEALEPQIGRGGGGVLERQPLRAVRALGDYRPMFGDADGDFDRRAALDANRFAPNFARLPLFLI